MSALDDLWLQTVFPCFRGKPSHGAKGSSHGVSPESSTGSQSSQMILPVPVYTSA